LLLAEAAVVFWEKLVHTGEEEEALVKYYPDQVFLFLKGLLFQLLLEQAARTGQALI
jgi:hypothetical protein